MMATYIPYSPAMDPLGSALGGATGAFGAGMLARHFTNKDMQAFDKWLKENQAAQNPMSYAAMGPLAMNFGPQMAQPTPFPTMRSPFGQQMAVDYRQGQMANMNPPGPIDQARMESLRAKAERDRAYADQLQNPAPEPKADEPRVMPKQNPYGLPEGTLVQFDRNGNMKVLNQPTPFPGGYTEKQLETVGLTPQQVGRMNQIKHEQMLRKYGAAPTESEPDPDYEQYMSSTPPEERLKHKVGYATMDPGGAIRSWTKTLRGIEGVTDDDIRDFVAIIRSGNEDQIRQAIERIGIY